jgi:hypothetical protein
VIRPPSLDCDVTPIVLRSGTPQKLPKDEVLVRGKRKVTNMAILRPARFATPLSGRSASRCAAFILIGAAAILAPACGKKGADIEAFCPSIAKRVATTPALTAAQFCQLYLQTCVDASNPPGGYTTLADCEAAYPALMFETTRECRSYHLCNAASYDTAEEVLHCLHTMGLGLCLDTASGL